ncbi:hypothetical protein PAQ31011_00685 [Pandoraea aquatica]|uniref:Uncharacterized protein n=1 Tax=Pandoraea aquatica TaxID=2508290 RepID=A0A5E4SAB5_9BURK|nr:hypothetical protein PAQ31011_00685 [Pandoraea aquatica]
MCTQQARLTALNAVQRVSLWAHAVLEVSPCTKNTFAKRVGMNLPLYFDYSDATKGIPPS